VTGRELINRLKALRDRLPSVEELDVRSPELLAMLGEVEALVGMWDRMDAIAVNIKTQFIHIMKESNYLQILGVISKVLHELEIKYPEEDKKQVYAAGEAYDFYSDFRCVVLSANISVFLIDPYINEEVFNLYIDKLPNEISCRVLLGKLNDNVRAIVEKLKLSPKRKVEVRQSKGMHDRVVFIDNAHCWLLGQSIKDAAKKKPTYLVELPEELTPEKLSYYERIWGEATEV
jgi:hypothetical protein